MSSKTYEQKVARLVQDALGIKYTTALNVVVDHKKRFPEGLPEEVRARLVVKEVEDTMAKVLQLWRGQS
jgi:hypothetical protein